jgi:endonuclease IV
MFGSHLSIAGGLHNALLKAEELGHSTTQIFTKNCSFTNGQREV